MSASTAAAIMAKNLRTRAFDDCLEDGSLWVSRLHELWAHVAAKRPRALPGVGKAKKKKGGEDGGGDKRCPPLVILAPLEDEAEELRSRCAEICGRLMPESGGEEGDKS